MQDKETIVDLAAHRAEHTSSNWSGDLFLPARDRIKRCLIHFTLVESYHRFCEAGLAYPFIEKEQVFPENDRRAAEMHPQNTALVFLLDQTLPRGLNKNFRLRASNKVTWRNLHRLLPSEDHEAFKAAHCRLDAAEFENLFAKLLPSDYALLIEQSDTETVPTLSHMHVKVERLTDIALREVGKELGYIDRALFERGEDYVEELEAKFFEYYGFNANASGRKSAAAIAAQLFAKHNQRYSVFVTSQTDNRLTHLSEGNEIEQFFLVRLNRDDQLKLRQALGTDDETILQPYWIDQFIDGAVVVPMRVRYQRTAAAYPQENRAKLKDLSRPWIDIKDQAVMGFADDLADIPLHWAMI